MKKYFITGGDNCYQTSPLGRLEAADRYLLEVDEDAKTLRCVSREFGLSNLNWGFKTDVGELKRKRIYKRTSINYKYYLESDGKEIPVQLKNRKWGKDGEYGNKYGMIFNRIRPYYFVRWKNEEKEQEYWDDLHKSYDEKIPMKPSEYYMEETGYKWIE